MASFEPSKTLVLMALPQESQGLFESKGVFVGYTGVGKVKATYSALQLIQKHKPQVVLNLGTAGSIRIKQGQLVECTRFVQRDSLFLQFPQAVLETSSITDLPNVTCGTADFIEKSESQVQCEVHDMEAYALAYVCKQMKIPFHSIKFITDSLDENVIKDWKQNLAAASKALFNQYEKLIY